MNKILITGAGQLGSRHLQALANLHEDTVIYVQDPNASSLEIAQSRYNEIKVKNKPIDVKYIISFNDLPKKIDLAIISTNSDIRKQVIENLLDKVKVKYLIIEKFLFNKSDDFYYIQDYLNKKDVKAWVNCPRRMVNFYSDLKRKLLNEKIMEFNVYGTLWGLGTSSIHMIDLLSYLSSQKYYKIVHEKLDKNPIESKRKGFYELTGNISGEMGNINFNLASYRIGNMPFTIQIITDSSFYSIRDVEGRYWVSEKENNWDIEELKFNFPFQSQLTHLAVEQILESGQSFLTSYDESLLLHIPLLDCFNNYFNNEGIYKGLCPIT